MTIAVIPHSNEQEQLQAVADGLRQAQHTTLYLHLPGQSQPLPISPSLAALLRESVQELLEGHAVTLISTEQELSTTETARILGISRPFLVSHLLETGEIPHRMVGSHRRVALRDVLAYQQRYEQSMKAADELSEEAQRLGLY